jgi:hypothetical protein
LQQAAPSNGKHGFLRIVRREKMQNAFSKQSNWHAKLLIEYNA